MFERQVRIPAIGEQGQLRLSQSKIVCIGAGGLGCAVLMALAGAGVATSHGWIRIIDYDSVSVSNLNRQFLYHYGDIGKAKVDVAAHRLKQLNPRLVVQTYMQKCDATNLQQCVESADLIIDAADNQYLSELINHWCFDTKHAFVTAGVSRFSGVIGCYDGKHGPCYQCSATYAQSSVDCTEDGVLGASVLAIGGLLATSAIGYILRGNFSSIGCMQDSNTTGVADHNAPPQWIVDTLARRSLEIRTKPKAHCPVCGKNPVLPVTEELEIDANIINNTNQFDSKKIQANVAKKRRWVAVDIRKNNYPIRPKIANMRWVQMQSKHLCSQIESGVFIQQLQNNEQIVIVCQRGVQSLLLTRRIRSMHPKLAVYSLRGGVQKLIECKTHDNIVQA